MTETVNKKKAGGGLPPTTGRGNHLGAEAVNKPNHTSMPPAADGRKWEPFDTWLQRYERATGADSYRPGLPGAPRGY